MGAETGTLVALIIGFRRKPEFSLFPEKGAFLGPATLAGPDLLFWSCLFFDDMRRGVGLTFKRLNAQALERSSAQMKVNGEQPREQAHEAIFQANLQSVSTGRQSGLC
jgi:hypothetical protein